MTPELRSELVALGLYAKAHPGHRRQVGIVIDAMKHLARDPDAPGLRKHAAENVARLAQMQQTAHLAQAVDFQRHEQSRFCPSRARIGRLEKTR